MRPKTDILICGSGPVGMTLALALRQQGIDCIIIDKLIKRQPYCKALGITPRSLEVFDHLGIAQDIIALGLWFERMSQYKNGKEILSVNVQSSELPYGFLSLPQFKLENILEEKLSAHGIIVHKGIELKDIYQNDEEVSAEIMDITTQKIDKISCRYLIGCDGAHSITRKLAGLEFSGDKIPEQYMLADVEVDWDLPHTNTYRFSSDAKGVDNTLIFVPYREAKRFRISCKIPENTSLTGETSTPLAMFESLIQATVPLPCRLSELRWFSKYYISHRIANQYRHQRIFIAGDAAHIHPPVGGQGMNTGIQDAWNLAWKLAFFLQNKATEALLDTYNFERHAVGKDVVQRTHQRMIHAQQNKALDVGQMALLQDTQLFIHYRNSPLSQFVHENSKSLQGGDRAPDVDGMVLQGINFKRRMHDLLKDGELKHIIYIDTPTPTEKITCLFEQQFMFPSEYFQPITADIKNRIVVCSQKGLIAEDAPCVIAIDENSLFQQKWQAQPQQCWIVRPDQYLLYSRK